MLESTTSAPVAPPAPVPPAPPKVEAPGTTTAAPAAPKPEAPKPEKPPKPFSFKDEFEGKDKNNDGKLVKSELKMPGAKNVDANKDGKVEYREYRLAKVQANSFKGLDTDKDGKLNTEELSKMQRFDDRQYGDGVSVTKEEFVKTRHAELADNKDALRLEKFKQGLDKNEAKKMQKYAGKDGKLSAEEYVEGKKQAWRDWHGARQDKLFAAAGGEKGTLDVTSKQGARYKSYDADNDGKVSKDEFKTGYKADLKSAWDARRGEGTLSDKGVRERLVFGKDSFAEKIEMPAGDAHETRKDWWISQYGGKSNTNEDVTGWDNANCGPTSLTMVARAFGKLDLDPSEVDAAIEKSRRLMGDAQSERDGTSGEGIARGAQAYGLDADIVNNVTLKDIEGELKKGRLPIVNGNVIRPDGSYGGGHFYVVTKIENGKAYLNDPYSKTGPSVVSTDRLMHSIDSHFAKRVISIGKK